MILAGVVPSILQPQHPEREIGRASSICLDPPYCCEALGVVQGEVQTTLWTPTLNGDIGAQSRLSLQCDGGFLEAGICMEENDNGVLEVSLQFIQSY